MISKRMFVQVASAGAAAVMLSASVLGATTEKKKYEFGVIAKSQSNPVFRRRGRVPRMRRST